MSEPDTTASDATDEPQVARRSAGRRGSYVVVARRYRPQAFDELIGQEHIGRALTGAIESSRVGHAYLFTGARGVGKTSAARILAKALNCVEGPTATPCNRCDACVSISRGDDVDVLEIDGASNRGIDEIRELRQNVSVRPSRSRFKIYIIDEVHMLTREAFNALLKTLEEPPEHVKFIFCTTEPEKLPVTIVSRCQRFDFAGIDARSIARRLEQIVAAEQMQAEPEALALLARRAAGSMRDSQSLLEQLLAFSGPEIRVADVHAMLGTADDARLGRTLRALAAREPATALAELDAALAEGVDVGQFVGQLLGHLRDAMMAALGCPAESLLHVAPGAHGEVAEVGRQLGLETVLAAMQILDQTLARLRVSTHARTLVELSLVRIGRLDDLDQVAALVAQLRQGQVPQLSGGGGGPRPASHPGSATTAPSPGAPRSTGVENDASGVAAEPPESRLAPTSQTAAQTEPVARDAGAAARRAVGASLSAETIRTVWPEALERMPAILAGHARLASTLEVQGADSLVAVFGRGYTSSKDYCERGDRRSRIEAALAEVVGRPVRIEFVLGPESDEPPAEAPAARAATPREKLLEKYQHPLVQRAGELFGARPVRVEGAGQ